MAETLRELFVIFDSALHRPLQAIVALIILALILGAIAGVTSFATNALFRELRRRS